MIINAPGSKITNVDDYDKFVYAEIPNNELEANLFEKVVKHMMHGPCGDKNPKNPCMVNGNCKSHYPKAFSEKTMQRNDAYPICKRSSNRVTISNCFPSKFY